MLLIQTLKKTLSSFRPLHLLGIFFVLILFITSSVMGLYRIYTKTFIEVPAYGGSVDEGIIGSPRFINPLLAVSQSDIDLTRIVYSGLMKEDSEGTLVPDIASSVTSSEDGLTYTFTIRPDVHFHDGELVTADDILYTIALAQDETLKSSKKIEWEGVKVSKVDDQTVVFNLRQPYSHFLKSATLGILPKHVWKDVPVNNISLSDYNLSPIGSGPYKIKKISKKGGIPDVYNLEAFSSYSGNRGYIDTFNIHIYPNTEGLLKALKDGTVTQAAAVESGRASSLQDSSKLAIMTEPLPRIYGVFFNQNKNANLVSGAVRSALSQSIDRNQIITEALYSYGVPSYSPVPKILRNEDEVDVPYSIDSALATLETDDWKRNSETEKLEKNTSKGTTPLHITITTIGSIPEFEKTAEVLKSNWEKLGVSVDVQYYELADLNQKIIKTRDYEVLLYGTVIHSDAYLYAFWHSSQIKDPGLNLSNYTNSKVDSAIEAIRSAKETDDTASYYKTFLDEIGNDNPAAFIYNPEFIYVTNKKISGISLTGITSPEDRFKNVTSWYINTEHIWKGLDRIQLFKTLQDTIH